MMVNITVVPEIPNASVRIAAVVKAFARQSARHAARTSWVAASSMFTSQSDAINQAPLTVAQSNGLLSILNNRASPPTLGSRKATRADV